MSKYILCSHVLVLSRADVLRPTEQSLAAISRPIAEADGQGRKKRGRQGVERQSKPFLVELGR